MLDPAILNFIGFMPEFEMEIKSYLLKTDKKLFRWQLQKWIDIKLSIRNSDLTFVREILICQMEMQNMSTEESQSTLLKTTCKEKILQTVKCQKEKSAEEGRTSVIWKLFGNLGKIQHLSNTEELQTTPSLCRDLTKHVKTQLAAV